MATDAIGVKGNQRFPDHCEASLRKNSRLSLASFSDETVSTLQDALPDEANVYNPVDVIGDAEIDRFREAIDVALSDDGVGAAVVVSAPTAVLSFEELAEAVLDLQEKHDKPVVTCLMGGESAEAAAAALREGGIPNYFDPARGVRSLEALSEYRDIRESTVEPPAEFDVDRERALEVLRTAEKRGDNRLGVEAMDLLDAYGIPTPKGDVVDAPEDAVAAAQDIDGPVVMKIVSPDILHKSDIGGVKVGVENEDVYDAFEDLISRARNYQPDANLLGVQVQEMVDLDTGTETIVGMNRDPQFGPLVLFGLGGIFVEILEDTTVRVAPVGRDEATAMVDDIQAAPLLRGARGRTPADEEAIVETIQRLSQLVTDFPAILELDINPLVAGPDGVQAVDIRLTVDTDKL
jgi:acetyltransferase